MLRFTLCQTRNIFREHFRFMSSGPFDELERTFVDPALVLETLENGGVDFFTGVPDSLLKDFCAYVTDNVSPNKHKIAANEGSSIAMACGSHFATGKVPFIYMQNSGLGNAVNPLLSLADRRVYSVPLVVMIGWRGEPGKKDEPQHIVQGEVLPGMLASMNLNFEILPDYNEGAVKCINNALAYAKENQSPTIILVRKRTFASYNLKDSSHKFSDFPLSREMAIQNILDNLSEWDSVVGTTGFTSREIYECRVKSGQGHGNDFLTVGSMGHASAIALGIAIQKPSRQVYCIDGDGACLMHLGNLAAAGASGQKNFKHILLNNGVHDSVGAQGTCASGQLYADVAQSVGYKSTTVVDNEDDLNAAMKDFVKCDGPSFLEVKVRPGARKDLGRPKKSTFSNKMDFMENLQM